MARWFYYANATDILSGLDLESVVSFHRDYLKGGLKLKLQGGHEYAMRDEDACLAIIAALRDRFPQFHDFHAKPADQTSSEHQEPEQSP